MLDQKPQSTSTRRITISLQTETYAELERIAKKQDVSIAWVLRAAAKRYIDAGEMPLISERTGEASS